MCDKFLEFGIINGVIKKGGLTCCEGNNMQKIYRFIVLVVGLCMMLQLHLGFANEATWANLKSLKADFKQEIKGERGAIPVIYEGRFYAANNKVKWEYLTPLKKEIYLEKSAAYIYEPALKQVTLGKLKENIDFIQILKRVKKNAKGEYETTIADVKYTLIAKDSKPYLLSYIDSLDNQIRILFTNVQMNVAIDANVFLFQPPDDVEYIDAH